MAQVVAQAGIASRRKAELLVEQGAVKVNGRVVLVPQHMILPTIDEVYPWKPQTPSHSLICMMKQSVAVVVTSRHQRAR